MFRFHALQQRLLILTEVVKTGQIKKSKKSIKMVINGISANNHIILLAMTAILDVALEGGVKRFLTIIHRSLLQIFC